MLLGSMQRDDNHYSVRVAYICDVSLFLYFYFLKHVIFFSQKPFCYLFSFFQSTFILFLLIMRIQQIYLVHILSLN